MLWLMIVPSLLQAAELPVGSAPVALELQHFPDRLHAFVWRNWPLAPVERLAKTVGAAPEAIIDIGHSMGLEGPPHISEEQWRRSYITIIRRNWHLLPYEQLLTLLDWTPEELAFCLREDDFLYAKLGSLKPTCATLTYQPSSEAARARCAAIGALLGRQFPKGAGLSENPLFSFVAALSAPADAPAVTRADNFSPRYCHSYFAPYGDPLADGALDPYPDGYLARLAAVGADGVWLQAVLYKLFPFPWDETLSAGYERRLENLAALTARAKRQGIRVYLYLNEPRAMPLAFFDAHPQLKGATEGDHAAVCTSVPEVRAYLRDAVASICRAAPDLGGFFTITASENLSNCWSHFQGKQCPRCAARSGAEVVAEVNRTIQEGIAAGGSSQILIAWDWGWPDEWAKPAIAALPPEVRFMSVSEWSIPIRRGGIESVIGEYSISEVGPGPRAQRNWALARAHGMKTIAKIQANNTWELSAVPYIPAIENVARHAANLRDANVQGLMLGWTLGGYPSPNLDVVAEVTSAARPSPEDAMQTVAARWFGPAGPAVVKAWQGFSAAFREFPYNGGTVYCAPIQCGPANLCWGEPTGYAATMVGIPYDDLKLWRSVYPAEVFIGQFEKVAGGFDSALAGLEQDLEHTALDPTFAANAAREKDVAQACALHFRSVANQSRFVSLRDTLATAQTAAQAKPLLDEIATVLESEIETAKRLHAIQCRDARIGFEASNHYFYIPIDLAEKVVNCTDLRERWLPAQRAKHGL